MHKVTPDSSHDSNASPEDPQFRAAAQRAIDHYLSPTDGDEPPLGPSTGVFCVSPDVDTETLLVNAAETLSSANEIATALAFELDGPQRATALGIQQLLELATLLVDRSLEHVAPAV